MYPQNAPQRELYVSHTVGRFPEFRSKTIAVLLEDVQDAIVDGMGPELLFHGQQSQFSAIRGTDETIMNFSTEWHAPLVLDLTVLGSGVLDGFGFREVRLPAGVGFTIQAQPPTASSSRRRAHPPLATAPPPRRQEPRRQGCRDPWAPWSPGSSPRHGAA